MLCCFNVYYSFSQDTAQVDPLSPSPYQDKIFSSSRDGTLRAWHSGTLSHLKTVKVSDAWVTDIAHFQRSNRIAASSIDRSISFFDGSSYELVRTPLYLYIYKHTYTYITCVC